MGQSIVHFEIMGSDPSKSQKFYAEMFGWQLGDPQPELGNYAMVDGASAGLSGGIGSEGPVDACARRSTSTCLTCKQRSTARSSWAARLRRHR